MRARDRLASAAFVAGSILLAGLSEVAVQSVTGLPSVGFLVVTAVMFVVSLAGLDPADRAAEASERRVGELEAETVRLRQEVAWLDSPQHAVKAASELEMRRRSGPVTGSRGGLR